MFVGGGTPTLLAGPLLERVLTGIRSLPLVDEVEITVEANPETVSEDLAKLLVQAGVNRVSVGCQSFDPRHLKTLERWHEPENVARSVERLRAAGIENLNLDLIFGIPGQSLRDWERDLDRALALDPTHLSCYGLTYEPNTALTVRMRRGLITPIDQSLESAMYDATIDRLAGAGFEHYEISAWARPEGRCRHNLLYWKNEDWWPLGPGAAGHLRGLRWKNVPRLADYLRSGPWPPITDVEEPDEGRAVAEAFMLGLRLIEGLPKSVVDDLLDRSPAAARQEREHGIEVSRVEGLLEETQTHLRLTRQGLLLADTVIARLL